MDLILLTNWDKTMKINKVEIEEKKQTKSFKVPSDMKASMDSLDEWLASNVEYEGSLEWVADITKEIDKEITRRNNQPDILLSKLKLNLPKSITESMQECDKNYAQKGYSPEWNSTIQKILDKLIKAKTRQLSELFNESPPNEVGNSYKRKTDANYHSTDQAEGIGTV